MHGAWGHLGWRGLGTDWLQAGLRLVSQKPLQVCSLSTKELVLPPELEMSGQSSSPRSPKRRQWTKRQIERGELERILANTFIEGL